MLLENIFGIVSIQSIDFPLVKDGDNKKDITTTKPATKKPSTPPLKIGTKVTNSRTKAVYKVTGKNAVEYVKTTSKAKQKQQLKFQRSRRKHIRIC